MKNTSAWVALGLSVLLAACAGPGMSGLDPALGWRSATVVDIGRAADLAPTVDRDCDAGAMASGSYAVVRYRNGGRHSRSLGTSRFPADLVAGDSVHVNVLDCRAAVRR